MIGGGNGTLFSELLDRSDEVIDILATAHLALEVIAETLALRNSAHEAGSSRANRFCPGCYGFEAFNIPATARLLERLARCRIRNANGKRQAAIKRHLLVKQRDRFRRRHTEPVKHG